MSIRAKNINPEILVWAREQAGLTLDDAARALGLNDTKKLTATEKLTLLEEGENFPTRPQLLKMASTYQRPLITFYLDKPPVISERGEDFRQITVSTDPRNTGLLDALLRDVRTRQSMARSIIEDDEDVAPLDFIGSIKLNETISNATAKLRSFLEYEKYPPNGINTPDKLFSELRTRIESKGVFVLLIGNLGSHHTNISEKIFRGFAISDKYAPFIVINDQDARTARSFTLLHELVHLFVGSTGISGEIFYSNNSVQNHKTEKFCNDVASQFLLPPSALDNLDFSGEMDTIQDVINRVADTHNVSELMVAYRLLRQRFISEAIYQNLANHYSERWKNSRIRSREINKSSSGGPNYYLVKRNHIGTRLLELVGKTLRGGELTHSKAAKMLGTKISSVEPLLHGVKSVSGSYTHERGS